MSVFHPSHRGLLGGITLALCLGGPPLAADGVTLTLRIESGTPLPSREVLQRRVDAALPADLPPVLRDAARARVAAALDRPAARSLAGGGGNRAHVVQRGEDHSATLAQPGTGQRLLLVQNGRGAEAVIRQPEDVPVLLTFQQGFGRKR